MIIIHLLYIGIQAKPVQHDVSIQCNMDVIEKCDFEVQCNLFLDHDSDDNDSCTTESDCSSESDTSIESDVSDMDVSYERESTPNSFSDDDEVTRSVLY